MIRRRSATVFVSLVLLATVAQARAKKPESRPFELQVVDPSDNVLPGALVVMKGPDGAPLELTTEGLTDDAGKVSGVIPDTAASYAVSVTKSRFHPQQPTIDFSGQKLKKGQTALIKITLEPFTAYDDYAAAVKALKAKDLGAAEANLKSAVTLDPRLVKGYEVLAMVQLEQKRWDEALASADQALALEPENLSALRSRYDALLGAGKDEEADAALSTLAEKDRSPDVAKLLYNAGAQAVNAKQAERAHGYFDKALEIDPNLYQAHAALAEIAIADEKYDDAVAELDLVLGLAPRNFKAYERKIEVLKAAGKTAEADAVARQVAEIKAGN